MSDIKIRVIQPTGVTLEKQGDHLIFPGEDGDFGVSAGHTPFVTKIRPGVISLFRDERKTQYAIHDGFVTIEEDIAVVVTDTFEKESDIDEKRATEAKERAEKRLKDTNNNEIDFRRAEYALKRAVARLQIVKQAD